ncbi:uncharacterized protein TNCV_196631 [Trichonephila clavipes]|uniref:Uncharacterized protein n=1 Tax=Trichonephila clavipes TaxID=2585209 RepID=A0A8X6WI83_TRICX|nr:uncharacterized protein TNCV_196631 [Trichonephila clavipes]
MVWVFGIIFMILATVVGVSQFSKNDVKDAPSDRYELYPACTTLLRSQVNEEMHASLVYMSMRTEKKIPLKSWLFSSTLIRRQFRGCGSPVVKVMNHGRHVMSSSPVPLKTRRVGQRCTLNLSRAETSSRWCGVVVRRGRCQLRCRPRHLTMVQNYEARRQKPSCS